MQAKQLLELESGLVGATGDRPTEALQPNRSAGFFAPARPTSIDCGRPRTGSIVIEAGSAGLVSLAYCWLLGRAPDAEGLAYWQGQLDAGLSPVELIDSLTASPEYEARGVTNFRGSLQKIRLSPDRQAERDERAEAARQRDFESAIEQDAQRAADAAADAKRIDDAKRSERLRERAEISAADFDFWVQQRDLSELDVVTPAMVHGRRDGGGQRVNVVYVHLSATRGVSVSPGDRGRATVGTWASEIGAHAAINGNWYGPYDGPAVSGGVVYGGDDHFYTSLFGFTADGDAIIDHHREVNAAVDDRIVEGVSGHPTLVYRGQPTTDFGTDPTFLARHPRTAIALDRSGDILILVTVDGRSSVALGMTGAETVDLLVSLGAYDGVMLDGGGSTTMWVADRGVVNRPSGSPRSVGNQLAVFGD